MTNNTSLIRHLGPGSRRLVRAGASQVLSLVVLAFSIKLLREQAVDLRGFLFALGTTVAVALVLWRLYVLYRVLATWHGLRRGLSRSPGPDPLEWLFRLPLWRDALAPWLLSCALLTNLAIFAYVSISYASLPPFLPLHYSATGEVDRLGTPPEVFMMPGIGTIVLVTNVVLGAVLYRKERLASRMAVGASIFVQVLLLVATANIVSQA